jgi:hypothetical protein
MVLMGWLQVPAPRRRSCRVSGSRGARPISGSERDMMEGRLGLTFAIMFAALGYVIAAYVGSL